MVSEFHGGRLMYEYDPMFTDHSSARIAACMMEKKVEGFMETNV
jgi:hypothetical protein